MSHLYKINIASQELTVEVIISKYNANTEKSDLDPPHTRDITTFSDTTKTIHDLTQNNKVFLPILKPLP